MKFSEYIRMARINKGLKRAELARRIDVTPQYLLIVEKEDKIPSEEIIARLVSVLDLSEVEAFKLADKLPPRVLDRAKIDFYGGVQGGETED